MEAQQRFTRRPPRYTESSFVKKMEELGIGRPSTYAPTISTIQKRGYVEKKDIQGEVRNYKILTLKKNKITEKTGKETIGNEKAKLVPTDIGVLVNRFLIQFFETIVDYNFTANVEKEFDKIAEGECKWNAMINEFYKDFHKQIEDTSDNSGKFSGEKFLGVDPVSGKNVFVKIGRFGPVAQIGDTDSEEKPKFAGLHKDQSIESITLEEVLDLFAFPRTLGEYEDAEIQVAIGRFGPYIKHNNTFYSLSKLDDPSLVTFMRAVEIIESKRKADLDNIVSTYPENEDLKVLKGRFGIYIALNKQNYKIPKTYDPTNLSYQDCMDIINDPNNASKKRGKTK
jgi:DNA topoisomerase-1